jgi:IS5 family transposase
MLRNYLKGAIGNQLNTILAGTGFNLKKMLNRIKEQVLFVFFETLISIKILLLLNYESRKNRVLKV